MGCLQSYFRKAHSTGLSPSPSSAAAAAAVTSGKPSTPPGSNGHAPEAVGGGEQEDSSPPPRPPPKKSHEAKAAAAAAALAASKEPDTSQPPALPPKRHSKASSGSHSVKPEQQPGVEPGGMTTKADGSSSTTTATESSAPSKGTGEDTATSPSQLESAVSPEGISRTTPLPKDSVSEATDTQEGTNSSTAMSPFKKDENSTSPVTMDASRDERKSPDTADAQDGSQMSTPGPMETMTPTSVVISPPGDPDGSLGERISPLEDTLPQTEEKEGSRDTPDGQPQSTPKASEATAIPVEGGEGREANKEGRRPNSSVASKEMESVSVVSGSIITDSAMDKESPSEAAVRRSAAGSEEGEVSTTPKGRDSGLSSGKGGTPITIGRADDSGQGPAAAESEAREGPVAEATEVSGEVNKSESVGASGSSRPASTGEEKTEGSPTSVDECGNVVAGESEGVRERGSMDNMEEDQEVGKKSFGFRDSASLDTVVHVKTESSTEIPNALSSQEKVVSPQEGQDTQSPKSEAGEMPVTEDGVKEAVVEASPPETSHEVKEETVQEMPPHPPAAEGGPISRGEKTPSSATMAESEVSSPPAGGVNSSESPKEEPIQILSPTKNDADSPDRNGTKTEATPSPPHPGESSTPAVVSTAPASQNEPPPPRSPTKEKPSSPSIEAVSTVSPSQNEPAQTTPTKEKPSSPSIEAVSTVSPSQNEPAQTTPTKEKPCSPKADNAVTLASQDETSPMKETQGSLPPAGYVSPSVPKGDPAQPSPTEDKKVITSSVEGPQSDEEVEKPEVKEEAVPQSPKDKSEPTSEELPPPPPPPEADGEDQGSGEVMPPPPPPEAIVPTVTTRVESSRSNDRPLSATEEEVASILLAQTTADEAKAGGKDKERDGKDLPSPPSSAPEGDFPPPPDMSEDGEIQSPTDDTNGRTRSASFELVEVLNLGGSLEQGEDGTKEGGGEREGKGLVKRVPTPVNSEWPNEDEEDEEEERDSISPEATATPSVTSESKQSLEDAEGAGSKLTKEAATSGSLEGISEVPVQGSQEKAEEVEAKVIESPIATMSETNKTAYVEEKNREGEETVAVVNTSPDEKTPSKPSTLDEVFAVQGGGRSVEGDIVVPECVVTNSGPPPEVLATAEENLRAQEAEGRPLSAEEVRKEMEEVGRMEVEEVIKKAVVEAERRDRESRMSGEVLDEDTIVVEAAANEGQGQKEEASTKGGGEGGKEETAGSGSGKETPAVSKHEEPKTAGDEEVVISPSESSSGDKETAGDSPVPDAITKDSREGAVKSPGTTADPAAVTKVKTSSKSRAEGEVNGEAETEKVATLDRGP